MEEEEETLFLRRISEFHFIYQIKSSVESLAINSSFPCDLCKEAMTEISLQRFP